MTTRFTHVALLCLGICLMLGSVARADLRVVTTTTDLADLARAVGGEHVEVESICKGEQDPHYVQARPSYMVKLSRADLLISVGLDLEVAWLPSLVRGARNPAINPGKPGHLEASRAIKPIEVVGGAVDRSKGDIHPRGNPHYWLDPHNGKAIARLIAGRMKQLDPEHGAAYEANLQRFLAQLDAAIARWQKRMAPLRGKRVVSYHATFNYFIQRFGLQQSGYVESKPGIPPAPAHLAQLIVQMRKERVGTILHEAYHDRGASNLVAKRSGAAVLELPTSVGGARGASSYIGLIDHLVARTARALGGR